VWNDFLIVIDEQHVSVTPVMPHTTYSSDGSVGPLILMDEIK
jgi:hypothetical protein